MAKLRVAILFGGTSSEHDISCLSAAAVADHIDTDQYEVLKIGITRKGRWLLYPGGTAMMRDGSWETFADCVPAFISPDRTTHGIVTNHDANFDVLKLDVAFPVLHGKFGEDGTVQGLLELAGIPYVGCGVQSSANCMNKAAANLLFETKGIAHTPWLAYTRAELADFDAVLAAVRQQLQYPLFVKPASAGSSIGITKVHSEEDLRPAMLLASAHDHIVLVEQGVDGHEVECAVLGNTAPMATLPGEIVPCNESYDYEAKYQSGDASQLFIPARLPQPKLEEVREAALQAYRALGCTGLARVDFFVQRETGAVLLNEINTMPGFTDISMCPKLMEHAGIGFTQLIDRLIALARERAWE